MVLPAPALFPGSKVQFAASKRWWKVRAVSDDNNYVILTSPFNLQKTVLYTIIDNARGVRGPDNMVFSSGYESDSDVSERMRELVAGEIEVSRRSSRYVVLDIAAVVKPNRRMADQVLIELIVEALVKWAVAEEKRTGTLSGDVVRNMNVGDLAAISAGAVKQHMEKREARIDFHIDRARQQEARAITAEARVAELEAERDLIATHYVTSIALRDIALGRAEKAEAELEKPLKRSAIDWKQAISSALGCKPGEFTYQLEECVEKIEALKPLLITSIEELDALPVGSIVWADAVGPVGHVFVKCADRWVIPWSERSENPLAPNGIVTVLFTRGGEG